MVEFSSVTPVFRTVDMYVCQPAKTGAALRPILLVRLWEYKAAPVVRVVCLVVGRTIITIIPLLCRVQYHYVPHYDPCNCHKQVYS